MRIVSSTGQGLQHEEVDLQDGLSGNEGVVGTADAEDFAGVSAAPPDVAFDVADIFKDVDLSAFQRAQALLEKPLSPTVAEREATMTIVEDGREQHQDLQLQNGGAQKAPKNKKNTTSGRGNNKSQPSTSGAKNPGASNTKIMDDHELRSGLATSSSKGAGEAALKVDYDAEEDVALQREYERQSGAVVPPGSELQASGEMIVEQSFSLRDIVSDLDSFTQGLKQKNPAFLKPGIPRQGASSKEKDYSEEAVKQKMDRIQELETELQKAKKNSSRHAKRRTSSSGGGIVVNNSPSAASSREHVRGSGGKGQQDDSFSVDVKMEDAFGDGYTCLDEDDHDEAVGASRSATSPSKAKVEKNNKKGPAGAGGVNNKGNGKNPPRRGRAVSSNNPENEAKVNRLQELTKQRVLDLRRKQMEEKKAEEIRKEQERERKTSIQEPAVSVLTSQQESQNRVAERKRQQAREAHERKKMESEALERERDILREKARELQQRTEERLQARTREEIEKRQQDHADRATKEHEEVITKELKGQLLAEAQRLARERCREILTENRDKEAREREEKEHEEQQRRERLRFAREKYSTRPKGGAGQARTPLMAAQVRQDNQGAHSFPVAYKTGLDHVESQVGRGRGTTDTRSSYHGDQDHSTSESTTTTGYTSTRGASRRSSNATSTSRNGNGATSKKNSTVDQTPEEDDFVFDLHGGPQIGVVIKSATPSPTTTTSTAPAVGAAKPGRPPGGGAFQKTSATSSTSTNRGAAPSSSSSSSTYSGAARNRPPSASSSTYSGAASGKKLAANGSGARKEKIGAGAAAKNGIEVHENFELIGGGNSFLDEQDLGSHLENEVEELDAQLQSRLMVLEPERQIGVVNRSSASAGGSSVPSSSRRNSRPTSACSSTVSNASARGQNLANAGRQVLASGTTKMADPPRKSSSSSSAPAPRGLSQLEVFDMMMAQQQVEVSRGGGHRVDDLHEEEDDAFSNTGGGAENEDFPDIREPQTMVDGYGVQPHTVTSNAADRDETVPFPKALAAFKARQSNGPDNSSGDHVSTSGPPATGASVTSAKRKPLWKQKPIPTPSTDEIIQNLRKARGGRDK
ncbi:unnamed protein product [Amoebophrya sp. A25]|nr:unnamed protein product [Amoebophrya sp. A25]|eukprot:GSA25T00012805001.1